MANGNPRGVALLALAAAVFVAGGAWLARDSVVQNVDYQDYSTLNDSPMGASLLYRALSRTSLNVRRSYGHEELSADTTLFRVGGRMSDIPRNSDEGVFLAEGGRMVCAYAGMPYYQRDDKPKKKSEDAPKEEDADESADDADGLARDETDGAETNAVVTVWQETKTLNILRNVKRVTHTFSASAKDAEGALPWLSTATFELTGEATNRWQVLYARDGFPVLIETRFGKGRVILASDSFFLSNEALAEMRHPGLLSYLIGGSRKVVFDEAAHGLRDTRNVAWLLHRLRLYAVVGAIAFLLLLTLWQQACPLLPRQREAPDAVQRVAAKEDGIVSLLHRHLPLAELPRKMLDIWAQTEPLPDAATRQAMRDALERAQAARTPPLEICRALSAIARCKRKGRTFTQPTQQENDHA